MMILKHILYKYIPKGTADSILEFLKQNTVLCVFDFTHDNSLAACSTVKYTFSETPYSTYKLCQNR